MASFVVVVPLHRGASLGKIANKCDRWHIFEFSRERQRASARAGGAAGGRPLMLGEMGDLVEFSCRWSRRYAGAGATAKKKGKRDCHHDILLWHDFHL